MGRRRPWFRKSSLRPSWGDRIPFYGVRAPGQEHRDAPLSIKGRVIWWTTLAVLALGFIALIVFTR
jgi:hypothetical protein